MLIDFFFMWFHFTEMEFFWLKKYSSETKYKTAHMTFKVLSVLVNQYDFCMMNLGGDKIRCVAVFCQTDSDCSNSIDSDEEKCKMQNACREFANAYSEISFLIGLRTNAGRVICYNGKII